MMTAPESHVCNSPVAVQCIKCREMFPPTSSLCSRVSHSLQPLITGKMELDIALMALAVDELESVDTPALHMPPIRWYTIIVQQICQLHMVHSQIQFVALHSSMQHVDRTGYKVEALLCLSKCDIGRT